MTRPTTLPGPLYRDPIQDGAADPVVVWNSHESAWWMVYTSRRTISPEDGVAWVHGTPLGVASSMDGAEWVYRGDLVGLETEWGTNTFWAPEIIEVDGTFHMYVSYIRGVPNAWPGHDRTIRHYTSPNLIDWTYRSELPLSSRRVIDACVYALPGGGWRLWYKDEADGNNTWIADSPDLYEWKVVGRAVRSDEAHEGPNVFELGGSYWMLVDAKCQRVYRSDDLEHWEYTNTVLDIGSGAASDRVDDAGPGLHADVVVNAGRAWVFYFTHPDRHDPNLVGADPRRSSIQVGELVSGAGGLSCRRDSSVVLELVAPEPYSS